MDLTNADEKQIIDKEWTLEILRVQDRKMAIIRHNVCGMGWWYVEVCQCSSEKYNIPPYLIFIRKLYNSGL